MNRVELVGSVVRDPTIQNNGTAEWAETELRVMHPNSKKFDNIPVVYTGNVLNLARNQIRAGQKNAIAGWLCLWHGVITVIVDTTDFIGKEDK